MSRSEESGSPGWFPSYFTQKTEVGARTAATSVRSPRPSVLYSSNEDSSGGQLHKLQRHVSKVLRGFSHPPKVNSWNYNPEILTTLKRQWTHFQLQSLDHKSFKEPLKLFESMVVVGLHPNYDSQALQRQFLAKRPESSGKIGVARSSLQQSRVLFVYPPEKQLPLKYKDLISFCFPGGLEVRAVDRTPSMSEINEILLSQEHLKQSDLSFVFRLQVADNSTLYGCCVLVQELVQKPSGLISMISDKKPFLSSSRHVLTTRRCYCILSRLPFFELHFGVLNSILNEERLEQLTTGINDLDLESQNGIHEDEHLEDEFDHFSLTQSVSERDTDSLNERADDNAVIPSDPESDMLIQKSEYVVAMQLSERNKVYLDNIQTNRQTAEGQLPYTVSPLHFQPSESSDSSSSFLSSPSEDRYFRGDIDETGTDETSFSGQDYSTDHNDALEWAKANNYGSLQIICEYYLLHCPSKGSTLTFNPLEHLHPLEFRRPAETIFHIGGSTIDLKSCSSRLQLSEAHSALLTEEEAAALSAWTIACECGTLRLENVLMMFVGALLEKQVVVVCSNLGTLSALVLSVIPLLRPYQWQCFLMPILPDDMLDFLDAPIPYVVGVKNKTAEVQSKMSNVILVDANKNQVKTPTLPQLPQHKELFSSLSPYHAKLVGESYLAKKRPVYECTDIQIEAAKGFLSVVRSYLDSLCSNLRSHTITNVQSNNDKVSLLLKESFIESFPSRDRPFMKLFVETQLFSVHTDLVLSSFQKE